MSEEDLRQVPAIFLVAGGTRKAAAIRQQLNDEHLAIRILATDLATAKVILDDSLFRP